MATIITDECINCGACEPECPNGAIAQGEEIYVIDAARCTECVGHHDEMACAAVCPVDCCVVSAATEESEEQLYAKLVALHADKTFPPLVELPPALSRFRKTG
jgi:ferredoxin